jgi:hypothetical protein
MCVYMHSRFVENHPIRILEDGPLIFEVVLSQSSRYIPPLDSFINHSVTHAKRVIMFDFPLSSITHLLISCSKLFIVISGCLSLRMLLASNTTSL